MRLTEPRDVGEGNISEQRDKMIVNRGMNYYRRDLSVKVKPTCDCLAVKAPLTLSWICISLWSECVCVCVSTWTGPYQSTDNRTIRFLSRRCGRWRWDAACMPVFMMLYYLIIPQRMKRFTTGDATGAAQSSRRTIYKSLSLSNSRSCRWVQMLLFCGLFEKCCSWCKQFKYHMSHLWTSERTLQKAPLIRGFQPSQFRLRS